MRVTKQHAIRLWRSLTLGSAWGLGDRKRALHGHPTFRAIAAGTNQVVQGSGKDG